MGHWIEGCYSRARPVALTRGSDDVLLTQKFPLMTATDWVHQRTNDQNTILIKSIVHDVGQKAGNHVNINNFTD